MFRGVLREETRERLDEETKRIDRLHGMPDRFLGRALLQLGREASQAAPKRFGGAEIGGYGDLIVRAVIPRLASGLGETNLTAEERSLLSVTPADPEELRMFVGTCMGNSDISTIAREVTEGDGKRALDLLARDFVNGNPITIALDRVVPPNPECEDWVVRHMREISRVRFGHEDHIAWSPAFQSYSEHSEKPARKERDGPVSSRGPEM